MNLPHSIETNSWSLLSHIDLTGAEHRLKDHRQRWVRSHYTKIGALCAYSELHQHNEVLLLFIYILQQFALAQNLEPTISE